MLGRQPGPGMVDRSVVRVRVLVLRLSSGRWWWWELLLVLWPRHWRE
jgi:hypothetical protein